MNPSRKKSLSAWFDPEADIPDPTENRVAEHMSGRDKTCLRKAMKSKRLERSLETEIPADICESLERELTKPMKIQKNESFPGGDIKAALNLAGLSKKAGRLVIGTDKVCDDVRGGGKIRLVAAAEDISENTGKRLADCCSWHGVQLEKCPFTSEQLGAAVGRESGIACAGFTDEGFAKAFLALAGTSESQAGKSERKRSVGI